MEMHPDISFLTLYSAAEPMSDAAFEQFCTINQELRIERESSGNLLVMPPVHTESGSYENVVSGELYFWNRQTGLGKAFSPSTGFTLPDTSVRSADASWVSNEVYAAISAGERKTFARLVPAFVAEVLSDTDSLRKAKAKAKMADVWIANGVQLGWLIDVKRATVYIYRANGSVEVVNGLDQTLSGETVLSGFELALALFQHG